ncbi:hypothetical protein [Escherichia coli]|uniref:hypothetical protein n=1 Tax=Escherichia coli TaxID=562 RepID=UPI003A2091BF
MKETHPTCFQYQGIFYSWKILYPVCNLTPPYTEKIHYQKCQKNIHLLLEIASIFFKVRIYIFLISQHSHQDIQKCTSLHSLFELGMSLPLSYFHQLKVGNSQKHIHFY